jgi:protein-S-isoprenylcysteine O-methyltransferase Ste14
MMRWVPLLMLVTWIALVRVRMTIQKHVYGRKPVHRGEDRRVRLLMHAGQWGVAIQLVIAILVAFGHIETAAHLPDRIAGIALGFGGAILMFTAQMNMGPSWRIGIDSTARTALITHGWYAYSRNPIYVFVIMTFIGFALLVPNVVTWALVIGSLWGFRSQVLHEERWLAETHGADWYEYAGRVGRFVPFLGRLR